MKYHVPLKTTMLTVALSAVTFNASADWMIKNGFCQTVTDNGQMLVMLKVTNISVVGQLPCQSKYYMRGETVAINGYPYPALGICDASTSWKPISIVDTRQVDATKIFAAVAAKEQTIVAAQGGSDVIRRSDYLQVCPSVLPSLTNMNVPAQRSALSMDVILAAAKHAYLLRLDAWTHPVLRLKRLGLSKACRRLVITLMKRHQLTYLHIDALGDVLPDFATFDW